MTAETDLNALLRDLSPQLDARVYVFVTTRQPYDASILNPLLQFEEAEGTTLIVSKDIAAAHNLAGEFPCRRITLNVHSSLAAVGFMAAVAACLSDAGISTNPVAGFHHDHLFVPADRANDALAALERLAADARAERS